MIIINLQILKVLIGRGYEPFIKESLAKLRIGIKIVSTHPRANY